MIKPSHIKRRNYRKMNRTKFIQELSNKPWEKVLLEGDVNAAVDHFTQNITEALDVHAPLRQIPRQKTRRKFLPPNLIALRKERDTLKKELLQGDKDAEKTKEYRQVRNKFTSEIRKEKKRQVQEQIKADPSPSNIWRIVNAVVNPRDTQQTIPLHPNDLNSHFVNKISLLQQKIDPKYVVDPLSRLQKKLKGKSLKFSFKPVKQRDVRKIIGKLRPASAGGPDGIDPEILKIAVDVLSEPLTHIINLSLQSGIFPEKWKLARITPIYKQKGSKSDPNSYRPISCLSVPAKILETCAKIQIVHFFESNKLFSSSQHGFRSSRSTTSALISMCSIWQEAVDKKKCAGVLSFDLTSAFDAVDSTILHNKLRAYGFDTISLNWIRDYLTNRKQFVRSNSKDSSVLFLVTGSPQGSVISPVLFIIILADIDEWTQYAIIVGFADDNCATVTGETLSDVAQKLESDADEILKFMASNKLLANDSKTTFMIFGKRDRQDVKIRVGNAVIKEQDTQKILGVHITSDLKWNTHVQNLKSKLLQRLHLMRHLGSFLPRHTLNMISDGIFNSQLRYALPLYLRPRLNGFDPMSSHLNELQVIHNDMIRLVGGVHRRDKVNMSVLRKSLKQTSINQMLCQALVTETRKIIQNDTVPSLKNIFMETGKSIIETRARSNSVLRAPLVKTRAMEGFATHAPKIYNQLPTEVRESRKIEAFKNKLNAWIIEHIP